MFFWNYTIFLLIPPLLLAIYAQYKVKSTFQNFSKKKVHSRISGSEVAKEILNRSGIGDVSIEKVEGRLSDHYDPRSKTLRLSETVYSSDSIASLGVAAHETGHAIQHHNGYVPLSLRNLIYPVANIGSSLAFPLFFIGFLFSSKGPSLLMDIGIFLFAGAVVFSILTLPVEFDASRRALALLHEGTYLDQEEIKGARKVLSAAALTYVASTAMAVMQLVRLLILRGRR
jgi:Zn-dependent membrane protease YugP